MFPVGTVKMAIFAEDETWNVIGHSVFNREKNGKFNVLLLANGAVEWIQ